MNISISNVLSFKHNKGFILAASLFLVFVLFLVKYSVDIKNLKANLKITDQKISISRVLYKTPDNAARAWVIKYNPAKNPSTNLVETGSYIFSYNGMYGYTPRDIGYPNSINIDEHRVPKESQIIGAIHSHPRCGLLGKIVLFLIRDSNENFSATDLHTSQKYKILAYMETPTGCLKRYSPFTKNTIIIKHLN